MDKMRMQFEFSPEAARRLDELVESTHAASRAEVVRRALLLMDRIVRSTDVDGVEVVLRSKDGSERILVLG